MDLASMLNNDGDASNARNSRPSVTPQAKPVPVPHLSTELRSPYSAVSARQGANEYPFPTQPTPGRPTWHPSRGGSMHENPHSASSATYSQPYSQVGTPASPYGAPPSATTPGGYSQHQGHAHHLPTRNSLSRTPSSPYDQPHSAHQDSPVSVRSYSQQVSAHTPHQQSLPGTPLGPPTSHYQYRDSQPPSLQQQPSSAISHTSHTSMPAPSPHSQTGRPRTPPLYHERSASTNPNTYREREQSVSVSPKTVPGTFPRPVAQEIATPTRGTFFSYPPGYTGEAKARNQQMSHQAALEKKVHDNSESFLKRPSTSPGLIRTVSKTKPPTPQFQKAKDPPHLPRSVSDQSRDPNMMLVDQVQPPAPVHEIPTPIIAKPAVPTPQVSHQHTAPILQPPQGTNQSPAPTLATVQSTSLKRSYDSGPTSTGDNSMERAAKRLRYKDPPIWAQKSRKNTLWKKDARPNNMQHRQTLNPAPNPPLTNGHSTGPISAVQPTIQPEFNPGEGPLGLWEPSILNVVPHEELTRKISHFLFKYVVNDETLKTGAAGGVPSADGQLEIEAKIGRIIDRNRNQRLDLPIETEAVLRDDVAVGFESFMTEAHHERMNNYLNEAVKQSRAPAPKPRVPIAYKHTHETDTFYELPISEITALPPSLQRYLNSKSNPHKPKLRITREQRTGTVLAKIIKVRVADLHVLSPSTEFDWRVSVNVEMNWEGDLNAFIASLGGEKRAPDRHKDRVSYSHLAYQIDLTQVKGEKLTHELEVEVSSETVRRQGQLARDNQPDQYEDLIRGFVDNVRILTRATKEH